MEILVDIMHGMDYGILAYIAETLRGGSLDPVMTVLSLMGNGGAVWIATAVLLLFFRKTRRAGVAMLLALAAGYVIGNLCIKELVMRPRPFVTHSDLTALLDRATRGRSPRGTRSRRSRRPRRSAASTERPAFLRSFWRRLSLFRACTRACTTLPMFLRVRSSAC